MLYLKHFNTDTSRTDYDRNNYVKHVSYSIESDSAYITTHKPYLTFSILSNGTVQFSGTSSGSTTNTIQYSINNGETWSEPAQIVNINVNVGDNVMWKGEMTPISGEGIGTFSGGTAKFDLKFDVMSLLYGDDFETNDDLKSSDTFRELFAFTNVVNTNLFVLKSNTLTQYCYWHMFQNCQELIEMPYLFAQNLRNFCYGEMFIGCIKLKNTKALSAERTVDGCYIRMFNGCTSLIQAPILMSKEVSFSAYEGMFANCSSLIQAPTILPAMTISVESYRNMFANCISLTQAPVLPATNLAEKCYENMFSGCTSLTNAPELPATNLVYACYRNMFTDCTNLNYIKILATNFSTNDNCFVNWVDGVASSGTFVKKANATFPSGVSGIPNGWTVQNI